MIGEIVVHKSWSFSREDFDEFSDEDIAEILLGEDLELVDEFEQHAYELASQSWPEFSDVSY